MRDFTEMYYAVGRKYKMDIKWYQIGWPMIKKGLIPFLICSCIILGTINNMFTLLSLAACAVFMAMCNEEEYVPFLFFILPFAPIFKLSGGGTSCFTYVTILYVCLYFVRTNWKMNEGDAFVLIIVLYVIACECISQTVNVVRTVKFANNLLLIAIFTNIDNQKWHRSIFISYILGFIISGMLSAFASNFLPISDYVTTKVEFFPGGTSIERFAGLYNDPNYFSINVIISLCLITNMLRRNEISSIAALSFSLILIYFAAKTGSKSALLMLAFPAIICIWNSIRDKRVGMIVFFSAAIITGIYLVQNGHITIFSNTLNRLESGKSGGIERITSGRYDIWKSFVDYFERFPFKTLIGNGVGVLYLDGRASHNTYIDFIYQLGIVGTGLYCYIISRYLKKSKIVLRRNINNYAVTMCIVVMYAFLSQLQEFDLPFQITLAIMTLNTSNQRERIRKDLAY